MVFCVLCWFSLVLEYFLRIVHCSSTFPQFSSSSSVLSLTRSPVPCLIISAASSLLISLNLYGLSVLFSSLVEHCVCSLPLLPLSATLVCLSNKIQNSVFIFPKPNESCYILAFKITPNRDTKWLNWTFLFFFKLDSVLVFWGRAPFLAQLIKSSESC